MAAVPTSLLAAGWSFDATGGPELSAAVRSFLSALSSPPQVLGLGEPTHGEPAFPQLRNRIFEVLVDHGFRSIAVESDRVAALDVDAFVRGERGTLESAMDTGFSHGFGRLDANRDLVAWMRAYNDSRPAAERLAFYGFDPPLEMTGAPSPRRYLQHLHGYLAQHLGSDGFLHGREDLQGLLGEDERWTDPAVIMTAEKSVGASPEAVALRAVADDLLTALYAHAPRLVAASSPADWRRAELHGKTTLGLLRYHAQMADVAPPAERTSRLLAVRDALMAQNLLDIRGHEQHRGATLVFAHNRHLQRHPSTWRLADMDLEWFSAGSILSTVLDDRYAVVVGSLGASAALGLDAPAGHTFEGALAEAAHGCALFDAVRLRHALGGHAGTVRPRTDITAEQGYFPLDAATLEHCEAVLHIGSGSEGNPFAPTPAELADRILALPDVAHVQADEGSGAPESSWGDRFFFVGPDRRQPFATIVEHDTPGFDEDSHLDRPGVFRLSMELGREEFERQFGYRPAEFPSRHSAMDFTRLDEIFPHPVYGTRGWACILNPSPRCLPDVDRLLACGHRLARDRRQRALDRHRAGPTP
ncbi:MAG TPA: DUF6194 family protein [Pilimelia sp.]|nr:DUF6194 family protein [Pilimelia sp.]